jgi:cell division transport system permease protein
VIVYLDENIAGEEETVLKNNFMKDPDIEEVEYISKEQALNEVRNILGGNALVLDVFNENPLPPSFELKLKSNVLEPALVTQKTDSIKQMPGVKEVQYGENWLSSLNNMSNAMRTGSMFFGFAIFIAVTFMMYSTIKIFYNKRKYNIETQKLLGAPRSFIRLPFMIEGLFVGTASGFISSFILFAVYSFTSLKLVEFMPSIGLVVTSLPMMVYISVPIAGAAMSIIGSLIAVGKISY